MANWIIQKDMYSEEEITPLIDAVNKYGKAYLVDKYNFSDIERIVIESGFDNEIVFYGSIQTALKIKRSDSLQCSVHVFLDKKFSELTTFSYLFNGYCLNSDYILAPLYLVKEKIEDLTYYRDSFFMRPNSGIKPFTGQENNRKNILSFIDFLERSYVEPTELCVVAPTRKISREYRLLVVNDFKTTSSYEIEDYFKVITATSYPDKYDVPQSVLDFGQKVLDSINNEMPDVFTLDICESDGKLYVLEVGSFSCSGLYWMDMDAVVTAINNYVKI